MAKKTLPTPCVSCGEAVEDSVLARCARCNEKARHRAAGVDAGGRKLARCTNGHTLIGRNSVRADDGTRSCRKCGAPEELEEGVAP